MGIPLCFAGETARPIIYTLYPGFELFACPTSHSGGRNFLGPLRLYFTAKETQSFSPVRLVLSGRAKTTKKLNELRNPMGIFHVLQARPHRPIIYAP